MAKEAAKKEPKANTKDVELKNVSAVETATKALEQYELVRSNAIEELLTQRAGIDEQLERFGYTTKTATVGMSTIRRTSSGKPCRICGELGHDARRHRFEKASEATVAGEG